MDNREFTKREKDLLERESAVLAEYIRLESKWTRTLAGERAPTPLDDAAVIAEMERRIKAAILRDLGWRARFKRAFWRLLAAVESDEGGWPTLVLLVWIMTILFILVFI